MLTALTKEGKLFNLAGTKNGPILKKLKNERLFFCPVCKERVILKAGSHKIPHFSHQKSSSCASFSEPESLQHMQGKRDLYLWLLNQRFSVYLEKYLPKIKQRPDILLKKNGQWFAIEYQCSPIPLKSLVQRTSGYHSTNIKPIWILGGNPFQNHNEAVYHLSDFHWSFIQASEKHGLTLFSYSADSQYFHFISNISPISSKKIQGNYVRTSITNATFPIHFPKTIQPKPHVHKNWIKHKQKWLQQKIIFGKAYQDPFLLTLYESNCHPLLLPPIIGIPVDYMGVCKTHPAVWQFYIWHDCLRFLKMGDRITFKEVQHAIQNRTHRHHIQFRNLPFVSSSYQKRMVYLFLHTLVHYSYLKEVRKGTFVLYKTVAFPKNMEEVVLMEKDFLHQ